MTADAAASLFARLDRELWLITARAGARRGGLVATFVSQASIAPELPRVAVGVARRHHTWGLIEAAGAFALHLFGEDRLDWVWHFGTRSGRDFDKLDGLAHDPAATGSPVLRDALGWLDCRVEDRLDTGDRTLYLAEVVGAGSSRAGAPLTAKRLLQLAPPEKLRELRGQLAHDAALDAEAIRAWRRQRESGR
jgi:flavin reductase (DIM6/NTAB) family NADH-FMN oxidoreductase RutF